MLSILCRLLGTGTGLLEDVGLLGCPLLFAIFSNVVITDGGVPISDEPESR